MDSNDMTFNDTADVDTEEVVDYVEEEEAQTELPIDINSCLLLNNVYIESIDELKQYLISKRRENESRLQELTIHSTYRTGRDGTTANYPYSQSSHSLIPFMAPYFKDVRGLSAPLNADTIEKRANGEMNVSYVCTKKSWNKLEIKKLKDVVMESAQGRQSVPLLAERNRLTKDKKNIVKRIQRITELGQQYRRSTVQRPAAGESANEPPVPQRWDPTLDWFKLASELGSGHSADECELYWNNAIHPSVSQSKTWTKEEDQRLEELVKQYGMHDWDKVAEELASGRLAWQCCQRYQSELNRDLKRVGPLTKAEAETVEKVIDSCRVGDYIPWPQVKYFIDGRSLAQIKHYWSKINVPKRGDVWSDDENKVLTAAVKKYGTHNWRKVAQFIPGRSNRQCRERYVMRLNFGTERKLGNWTAEEDRLIQELAPKHQFQWVRLEPLINGRNARQIASRYDLLMKYKASGHSMSKTKNKFGNKSCFATRTLTVRNKLYERIRQMINRNNNQNEDLDRILRTGRAKLAKKLEMETKGIVVAKKGRPKQSATEKDIDSKIVEMFAIHERRPSPKTECLTRGAQDQCVYDTTKHIMNELMFGTKFESTTQLAKAIRQLIQSTVTRIRPAVSDKPAVASDEVPDNVVYEWTPPPILPPNRTTVRALRTLLTQTDAFSETIAKSNIPLDQLAHRVKCDPNYAKLLAQFKSLFCWPALLSKVEPPERIQQTEPIVSPKRPLKGRGRSSGLKARMVEIRSHQAKLIQTEMMRNAETKIVPELNAETQLNVKSALAPWYVTHKDRKYYHLKSLDKSSFVFTRVKPRYESIEKKAKKEPKSKQNKFKTNGESNEGSIGSSDERVEKSLKSDDSTETKRRKVSLKMSLSAENDFEVNQQLSEESLPKVERKVTRSQSRRRTRSSAANNQTLI